MGLMQQTEYIGEYIAKSLLCFNWTDILENLKHINPNAFNNKVIICKNIVHGIYNKMFLIDKWRGFLLSMRCWC